MADHAPSQDGDDGSATSSEGRGRSTTPIASNDNDPDSLTDDQFLAELQARRSRRELVRHRLQLTASKTRMMGRHQPFPWAPGLELLNYEDAPACIRLDELAFPYLPHRQSPEKVNHYNFIQHFLLCRPLARVVA